MERLALIGVSHRRGGAPALEAWQGHLQGETLEQIVHQGFSEAVVLQTCNRCDLVVALAPSMSVAEARRLVAPPSWPRCYAYVGEGAVEQIARIASSLDSLNPGEYQIMTQVREAYAAAEKHGTLGPNTRFAFPVAFRIAKRIRHEIKLAPLNTSLFSLARPRLMSELQRGERVAVIGAGKIGRLAAQVLGERSDLEIVLVNRSLDRAKALAQELSIEGQVLGLDAFLEQPLDCAALITATPVAQLVGPGLLEKLPHLRIIVDLGIPRNVDAEAALARGIRVLNVDTLQEEGRQRRLEIEDSLALAEELLLEELDDAIGEWIERQLGPSIRSLRQRYLEIFAQISGDALDPATQKRIASRMAHPSIKGLRALAREHGLQAARAFLEGAELDPE